MKNQAPLAASEEANQLLETIQLTQDEVTALWEGVNDQLTKKQRPLRPKIFSLLEKRVSCAKSQFLVGGNVKLLELKGEMGEVARDLLDRISPMADAVAAVQFLGKVVDSGNSRGLFQLCPPPLITIYKREASPFVTKQIPLLSVAPLLRDLIEQSLVQKADLQDGSVDTGKLVIGRLLLSSIIHGGLVEYSLVDKLAQLLCQPDSPLQCLDKRVYIEFSLGYRKQDDAEFRRWFIDPLTAALMMEVKFEQVRQALGSPFDASIPKKDRQKRIEACIHAFIRSMPMANKLLPRLGLSRVFTACRLDLNTRMPMMLVNYASRKFVSHSLKPYVWKRVHGAPFNVNESTDPGSALQMKRQEKNEQTATPAVIGDQKDLAEIEPRWMGPLRQSLKGQVREKVERQIHQLKSQNQTGFEKDAVGRCFADFALWLLWAQKGGQVRFKLPTVKDYVISVAKRLGGLIGMQTTDQLTASEWAALFEEVLADAHSKGMKSKLVRVLRELLHFLSSEKGVSETEAHDVLVAESGLVPVDANWLTELEFIKVRKNFVEANDGDLAEDLLDIEEKQLRTISKLVLTLSYRCGLRRNEVLMLEINDALMGDPAELLIRPTSSRTLKTPSATRKIPLYALLLDEELQELKQWVAQRKADENKQKFSPHLFAIPSAKKLFLQEDRLFRYLHKVMREVTGDKTLRFHHLRHTFASQINLLLMLSQVSDAKQLNVQIPGLDLDIKRAQDLRESLFRNQKMTRRDLWAVCFLLGHSGPDVSLEHYVHTLDLGLAWQLDQTEIAPSEGAVIAATGSNRVTLYRHLQKDSENSVHSWIALRWKKHQPPTPVKVTKADKTDKAATATAHPSHNSHTSHDIHAKWLTTPALDLLWNCLFLNQAKGFTPEWLVNKSKSQIFEIFRSSPISQMTRMIRNAQYLRDMTMPATKATYRHRFVDHRIYDRDTQLIKRIACPIKPIKAHDLACLEKLLPRFEKVLQEEPELSKSVLQYFAEHAHPKMAAIHFENPQLPTDAINFLSWFEKMGLSKSDLRIDSYDKITPRSKFRAGWKTALNLHTSAIGKTSPPIGKKNWACPWLGITPVFEVGHGGEKRPTAAFRYLMLMAYAVTN